MRRFNDSAVSPIVGFIIATVLFTVSFYYVVDTAVTRQSERPQDVVAYSSLAHAMSNQIFSKGEGWYTDGACTVGGEIDTAHFSPEDVQDGRFGLGDEYCGGSAIDAANANRISFEKMSNLFGASRLADADNDRVDYQEARESLSLEQDFVDFHIRSWPLLDSTREILRNGQQDPFMRPLYIGDYTSSGGGSLSPPTTSVVDGADYVTVSVAITNDGADSTTFQVLFDFRLDKGDISFTLHTEEVGPTETETVSFKLRKTSDWDWKFDPEIDYEVSDLNDNLFDGTIDMSAIDMANYASARKNVFLEVDELYDVQSGATPVALEFHYVSYDGKGDLVAFNDWQISILKEDGTPVLTTADFGNVKQGDYAWSTAVQDAYQIRLENAAGTTVWQTDRANVVAAAPNPYEGGSTYAPGVSVPEEVRYIDHLIENFQPNAYSMTYHHADVPFGADGDVYPDVKDSMNNDLVAALTDDLGAPSTEEHTTLFVGSNVDHNAMTSAAAKQAIRDWVHAGGTLIVMGSDDQSVNWLQPIFHSSLDSGSDPLYTPDPDHPVLNVPNDLDYESYNDPDTQWGYNAGADQFFTHVIQSGEDDILAVGNPGAFGEGKVILTSWRAYDLVDNQAANCPEPLEYNSPCEGLFLIHNLVTLSYRELYLDYGPTIPEGATTGVQLRIGSVYHPELETLIPLHIQVFAFGGS